MDNIRIAVFGYAFRHQKTCDFITRLLVEGLPITAVFAAPKIDLGIPNSIYKQKIRHMEKTHPLKVCKTFDVPYYETEHNNEFIKHAIKVFDCQLGIIAGARILDQEVIDLFEYGIINFHPGLVPENRGLDSALWAVLTDLPQGTTSHLISSKIDCGPILQRRELVLYEDDTIFDVQERLMEQQLNQIAISIQLAIHMHDNENFIDDVPYLVGKYHSKLTLEQENDALSIFNGYKNQFVIGSKI